MCMLACSPSCRQHAHSSAGVFGAWRTRLRCLRPRNGASGRADEAKPRQRHRQRSSLAQQGPMVPLSYWPSDLSSYFEAAVLGVACAEKAPFDPSGSNVVGLISVTTADTGCSLPPGPTQTSTRAWKGLILLRACSGFACLLRKVRNARTQTKDDRSFEGYASRPLSATGHSMSDVFCARPELKMPSHL